MWKQSEIWDMSFCIIKISEALTSGVVVWSYLWGSLHFPYSPCKATCVINQMADKPISNPAVTLVCLNSCLGMARSECILTKTKGMHSVQLTVMVYAHSSVSSTSAMWKTVTKRLMLFQSYKWREIEFTAAVKQIKPRNICINCQKQIVSGKQNRGWKCSKSSSLNLEMSPGFGDLESSRISF